MTDDDGRLVPLVSSIVLRFLSTDDREKPFGVFAHRLAGAFGLNGQGRI